MKKAIELIIVIITALSFIGCLRTYYPAIYQTSAHPMIYSKSDTASASKKYIGADLTISKADYENESLTLVKGNYAFADTKKHYNINYKVFGYAGNYKVSGLQEYDGDKSVFGAGFEFGTSLNFCIKSFKMGFGVNGVFASEFGGYYNFRKSAEGAGRIRSDNDLVFFMFSLYPTMAYEINGNTIISLQANLGYPGILSPSLALNNSGYVFGLSWIPDNWNRDDIMGKRLNIGFMINLDKL